MKKNIIIMVCAIFMFMGFNACKSKQNVGTGENKQTQSNMKSNEITVVDLSLFERRWKLVELNGNPVEKTEAFLIFDGDRVSGNLGCNTFSGSYELNGGNRIRFSQIASTLKMCLNGMEIEDGLKRVLEMTDNYNANEKNLVLNRARMAPLARFEAVE